MHTMEYSQTQKELISCNMDGLLEGIMLSEISQRKRNTVMDTKMFESFQMGRKSRKHTLAVNPTPVHCQLSRVTLQHHTIGESSSPSFSLSSEVVT